MPVVAKCALTKKPFCEVDAGSRALHKEVKAEVIRENWLGAPDEPPTYGAWHFGKERQHKVEKVLIGSRGWQQAARALLIRIKPKQE